MKRPRVADCLAEVERLKAENERLERLVKTQRPELESLRTVACIVRDLGFNLPSKLEELRVALDGLLPANDDDLPSLREIFGILSDGRERVYAALEPAPAADAVDPQVDSTGNPSTRDETSSSVVGSHQPGER